MANRTDSFNRADSTTTPNSPSDAAGDYTVGHGTWGIHSNAIYLVANGAADQNHVFLETSVTDGTTQFTLAQKGAALDAGVINRVADDANLILGQFDLLNTRYYKRVAGTFTLLGSAGSGGIALNDVVSLESSSGNVHTLKFNGVTQGSPPTESAGSTNTKVGMRIYGPGSGVGSANTKFDVFSFTAPAAGVTYPMLERFHPRGTMRGVV